ncbi:MAG TPA: DUF1275 family protein [Lapillicoccus sp.]|nr:DUF1275 family protein [Lapillicoccus sp.]
MSSTGRTEVALATLLAATAGAVDVLAFTRLGQAFASIVTGNLAGAGAGLGLGQPQLVGSVTTAVVAFAVGVLVGGVGVRRAAGSTARWPMPATALCAVELGFLVVLGVVWVVTGGAPSGVAQYVALTAAAVGMGLQSAAFRLVPLPGVTTTYFTGTLTVLLLGVVTGGRVNAAAVIALLALLAGAVGAGLLVAHAATAAVVLPVGLLVVVLVAGTVRRRELSAERGR